MPFDGLGVVSRRRIAGRLDKPADSPVVGGLFAIDPYRPSGADQVLDLLRREDHVPVEGRTVLRRHDIEGHGSVGADGDAVTAANAETVGIIRRDGHTLALAHLDDADGADLGANAVGLAFSLVHDEMGHVPIVAEAAHPTKIAFYVEQKKPFDIKEVRDVMDSREAGA
jgi:hypothetical protein